MNVAAGSTTEALAANDYLVEFPDEKYYPMDDVQGQFVHGAQGRFYYTPRTYTGFKVGFNVTAGASLRTTFLYITDSL